MVRSNRNVLSPSSGGWKSKVKVSAGLGPSGGSEPDSEQDSVSCFLPCCWRLLAILGVSWLIDMSLSACLHMAFFSLCLCVHVSNLPFLSLRRTPVIGFRSHPNSWMITLSWDPYLNFIHRDPISIWSHSQAPGIRAWTYCFGVWDWAVRPRQAECLPKADSYFPTKSELQLRSSGCRQMLFHFIVVFLKRMNSWLVRHWLHVSFFCVRAPSWPGNWLCKLL